MQTNVILLYHMQKRLIAALAGTGSDDITMHNKVSSGVAAGRAWHIWLYTKLCTFCVDPRWRPCN
eukprot:6180363-Pleurochrysis_carterae.AAC.2